MKDIYYNNMESEHVAVYERYSKDISLFCTIAEHIYNLVILLV